MVSFAQSLLIGWKTHTCAQLVELKNGETLNGHLIKFDSYMNLTMREVYQTSADPENPRFFKLPECYIRGSTIKYIRVPDKLLEEVKEEQLKARESNRGARGGGNANRGGRGAPQRGMYNGQML